MFASTTNVVAEDWLTECGNATRVLQTQLENETQAWHAIIAMTYNATNYDDYCCTDHFTSSCTMDFDSIDEEETYRAACLAAGGKLFAIDEIGRFLCNEKETDFRRLMNLKGHDECVAPICEDDELKDHYADITKDDAAFFSDLLQAECKWEKEFTTCSAAPANVITSSSSSALVVLMAMAAVSYLVM